MFDELDKLFIELFDINLPKHKIQLSQEERFAVLRMFFNLMKKFDPKHCNFDYSDITQIKRFLKRNYSNNRIIRYLILLISHVYTNPIENVMIKPYKDYLKTLRLIEEFHK